MWQVELYFSVKNHKKSFGIAPVYWSQTVKEIWDFHGYNTERVEHVIVFDKVPLETNEIEKLTDHAVSTFLDDECPRDVALSVSRVENQFKGNDAAIKAATAAFEAALRQKFM